MTDGQKDKLKWVLREWDCLNLEQAVREAANDGQLRQALVECGIEFPRKENYERNRNCAY